MRLATACAGPSSMALTVTAVALATMAILTAEVSREPGLGRSLEVGCRRATAGTHGLLLCLLQLATVTPRVPWIGSAV